MTRDTIDFKIQVKQMKKQDLLRNMLEVNPEPSPAERALNEKAELEFKDRDWRLGDDSLVRNGNAVTTSML